MVKETIIMLATIFMYNIVEAQSYDMDTTEQELGFFCDELPIFKVSDYSEDIMMLSKYITENIVYPQSANEDKIEGTVLITYVIDTCGNISNAYIAKGTRHDIDSAALQILKSVKYKSPAKLNGKPLPFSFTIPVNFKLPKGEITEQ